MKPKFEERQKVITKNGDIVRVLCANFVEDTESIGKAIYWTVDDLGEHANYWEDELSAYEARIIDVNRLYSIPNYAKMVGMKRQSISRKVRVGELKTEDISGYKFVRL